jgi:hypothetical protein
MDLDINENQQEYKIINIGDNTRTELEKLQEDKQKLLILGMRKFFGAVAEPLCKSVLQKTRILQPMWQKESWTLDAVK